MLRELKLASDKFGISITRNAFFFCIVFFFFFLTFISVLDYLLRHLISSAWHPNFVRALQYLTIASSIVISSRFFSKIRKGTVLFASYATLSIEGILLVVISSEIFRMAIIFTMIMTFSLILLSLFNWFWSMTKPEERGRVAGFAGLFTLPFYFLTAEVLLANLDFSSTALFGVLISLGVLTVLLVVPEKPLSRLKNNAATSYERKTVVLYSIPWILFSLVNATLAFTVSQSVAEQVPPPFYMTLLGFQVAGVAFGALAGGLIADIFGRRPSLMLGLTLYGISSALLGLTQNRVAFLFSYATNGLSWGILFILYVFVVWGDLATEENVGKTYSIGLAIYYSALCVGSLFPSLSHIPLIAVALANCLLIFLLNVPVIAAPELLHSDTSEKIRLGLHINKVKKIEKKSKNQG